MNYRNLLLPVLLIFSVSVSAQKYLSTESEEINQTWKEYEFSSRKTLQENLKDIPEMSFMTAILKQPAIERFIDNQEMLTVLLISDRALEGMSKKERDLLINNVPLMESLIKNLSIPGRIDENGFITAAQKHGGIARIRTLGQDDIRVEIRNNQLFLKDNQGRSAAIKGSNFYHKNGLFHIIDTLIFVEND